MNDIRTILFTLKENGPLTLDEICRLARLRKAVVTKIIREEPSLEKSRQPVKRGAKPKEVVYSLRERTSIGDKNPGTHR